MKTLRAEVFYIPLLLTLSCMSCAKENASSNSSRESTAAHKPVNDMPASGNSSKKNYESTLYSSGDILVLTDEEAGWSKGSLISMTDGDSEVKAQRIITILEAAKADGEFIQTVSPRLPNNRRLKGDNFTLPLIEENGNTHTFKYIGDHDNRLYTLNFRIQK